LSPAEIEREPDLADLRRDPRFERLTKSLKATKSN